MPSVDIPAMVPNTRVITELDSTAEITSQMGPSTVWAYMVFRFRITSVLMRVRYPALLLSLLFWWVHSPNSTLSSGMSVPSVSSEGVVSSSVTSGVWVASGAWLFSTSGLTA